MTFRRVAVLAGLVCAIYTWGFFRDLPYAPNVDERVFVAHAVRMASRGSFDPRWFGHPGSTVIYPLSALYSAWDEIGFGARPFHPDRALERRFESDPADFYVVGRCLAMAYAVAGVLATYLLARSVWGEEVALAGTALSIFAPVSLWFGRLVRTDGAGVFFGMLALAACLRILDRDDRAHRIVAGVAVGLAIATRYFLLALVPLLVGVEAISLVRRRREGSALREGFVRAALGLAAVLITFAVSTPFFFIDFTRALRDLQAEAQQSSLGADGLGFAGNLVFYLTDAIPENVGLVQSWLVLLGIGAIAWVRDVKASLLIGFVTTFLLATSLSNQHWDRWIIEISPVLSLIAAAGLDALLHAGVARVRVRQALYAAAVLLALAQPAAAVLAIDYRDSRPSTSVLAEEWIVQHLPWESPIVVEAFGPPLPAARPHVLREWRLRRTPEEYCAAGYRYVGLALMFYRWAKQDPERHAAEVALYERLFREGRLLAEFPWTPNRSGSTVRVYQLVCPQSVGS